MHSQTLDYPLSTLNGLVTHGPGRVALVRDNAEGKTMPSPLDVQVQSGDYFVTLATQLDALGVQLDWDARLRVEEVVSDLIYLQDNYDIVRKEQE